MKLIPSTRRMRLLALGAVLFIPSALVMFGQLVPSVEQACGQPAPDVRLTYSPNELASFAHGCGASGLAAYERLQVADLIYPAVAALFFAAAMAVAWWPLTTSRPWTRVGLVAVPVLAMLADYYENLIAWRFIADPTGLSADLANTMATASTMKTAAGWLTGILIATGIVASVVTRIRRRRTAVPPTPSDVPAALAAVGGRP